MRIAKVIVVLGAIAGVAGAFFGCGTSRPDAASGDGTVNGGAEACSTPGQSRDCKYILSEANNVRTCAAGSQTCMANGFWGACGSGGRAPSLLQSVNLSPASNGGIKLMNVNPPSDGGPACANPCDPACTGYNESCPDGGVLDASGDAASQSTFPPTTLPACATSGASTSSCDCTDPAASCAMACNSVSGCTSYARTGKTANFSCNSVTGLCDFNCEAGSTCNITCNSTQTCSTTCLAGSTCNVSCNSVSSCPVNCAPGATCNITMCNSSNCPMSSLGQNSNACYQAPPINWDNLGTAPGTNGGFLSKLLPDLCVGGGQGATCEIGPASFLPGRAASTCQADTYCEPLVLGGVPGGCCRKFTNGQTHAGRATDALDCVGALPDLTFMGACQAGGDVAIIICNRGNATATGPIWAGEGPPSGSLPYNSGTEALPTCLSAGVTYKCRYDGTIDPGECAVMRQSLPLGQGCGGANISGNSVWVVNGPTAPLGQVVPECVLDPKGLVSATQENQPGCANNLSAFGAPGQLDACQGIYAPTQIQQEYTAACAPGQRPKWTTLGWQGLTPSTGGMNPQTTKIEFFATLQGTTYDGSIGAPAGPQIIGRAVPNPNTAVYVEGPQVCSPATPTATPVCPKQLANTIGAPPPTGAGPLVLNYEKLTLDIYLYPSADGSLAPTLQNWWISYTCVDYE